MYRVLNLTKGNLLCSDGTELAIGDEKSIESNLDEWSFVYSNIGVCRISGEFKGNYATCSGGLDCVEDTAKKDGVKTFILRSVE